MQNYQQAVKRAALTLQASKALATSAIIGLWNSVEWVVVSDPDKKPAELHAEEASITLSPALLTSPQGHSAILAEFGQMLLRLGGQTAAKHWKLKLVLPEEEHINSFHVKLTSNEVRSRCRTYRDVLNTYPHVGNAVPRLVAIHLSNALIANNVPYMDSQGVNIYQWGPTAEYANRRKLGSIAPLTGAYCPGPLNSSYGSAFAALAVDELKAVTDSSVKEAMATLLAAIASRAG